MLQQRVAIPPRPAPPDDGAPRTLWGHSPRALHDAFWAWRGATAVRPGVPRPAGGRLFLLLPAGRLALLDLRPLARLLSWGGAAMVRLRLAGRVSPPTPLDEDDFVETLAATADGRFLGFRRTYTPRAAGGGRIVLTADARLADFWSGLGTTGTRGPWRRLSREVRRLGLSSVPASTTGQLFADGDPAQVDDFARALCAVWRRPDRAIGGVTRGRDGEWSPGGLPGIGRDCVGPSWIGRGRSPERGVGRVGPLVLWDDPREERRAAAASPAGREEPGHLAPPAPPVPPSAGGERAKRAFDVAFASAALLAALPLWPAVVVAIWLEDGGPFIFGHVRQGRGGRPFRCWKFRSMSHDADQIKRRLIAEGRNQADGAQFFMDDDPRITRVGRLLRRTNLDELPQFWNVLVGQMSVVGPRPSPEAENRYNPAWREARLSVRPGITGLWQVRRTRAAGTDFQEWVRFDTEYVATRSFFGDLRIVAETAAMIAGRPLRRVMSLRRVRASGRV